MESLSKIYLGLLPEALQTALQQQLACHDWQTATGALEADIILLPEAAPLNAPPAVPVMTLDLHKKIRLGSLLRQIRQILEEPSLYLDPFAIGPYVFEAQEKLLRPEETTLEGAEIPLTDKEVDILVFLSRHANTPVSRDALLKQVWRYQDGVDTHTLETHIYRLRQKMEKSAEAPEILVTRDEGYVLNI